MVGLFFPLRHLFTGSGVICVGEMSISFVQCAKTNADMLNQKYESYLPVSLLLLEGEMVFCSNMQN